MASSSDNTCPEQDSAASFQISSSSGQQVPAMPARTPSRETKGSRSSSSSSRGVKKDSPPKPLVDRGPGTGSLIPFSRHRPPSPMASDVELIPDVTQTPGSHRPKPSAAPVKCIFISIVVSNTMLFRIVGSFICMSAVTFNRVFSLMSGWTLLMWHNKLELRRPRLRTKPEHLKHMFTVRRQPKPKQSMFGKKRRLVLNSSNTKPSRERERERQRERESLFASYKFTCAVKDVLSTETT